MTGPGAVLLAALTVSQAPLPPTSSGERVAPLTGVQAVPVRETIAEVRVHGNVLTPDDELVALTGVTVGAPFEQTTIADILERLRRTGRFADIDVRKRYASIADPSLIVVVIVVDEGPVRIVLPRSSDEEVRVVPRRGLSNLMYLPILDAEDGYGITYGARVAYVGLAGEKSRLSFPLSWGGLKRAGVEVDRVFASGPFSRVEVGGAVLRQRNPGFDVNDDRRRLWARAERQAGRIRFGAGGGWQRVSFAETEDTLRTVGIDVTLDTRRSPVHPRNAVYARASVERIGYRSGGDVRRTELDGRGYLGLVGQSVLVLRARRLAADRPLPDYLKPLLGGW